MVASQRHYVQWGSKVRCTLLDMSKAFDMVDHGHLFDLLLQHKLPYPVLRSWFSGTLNNAFKSDRGAPFYFLYGGKWCTVGWDIVPYLVYCIHWRAYAAIVESWRQLSLERTVCWLPMLCRWSCSTSPTASALRRMLKICSESAA